MQKYLTLDCPLFYPKRPMNNSILLKVDTDAGEFTFIDTTTKGETKEYPISIGGSGSGDEGGSSSGSSITYTAGDGITLSNHEFSITPDNSTDTNKFLVIGSNGIGLNGITNTISEAVSGKADKAELEGFITEDAISNFITIDAISGKADKAELESFVTAEDIEAAISGKADKTELITAEDVESAVSGKADKAELERFVTAEDIEAAVSGKADKAEISEFVTATEVAEAIINKADKSEIENFITADAISGKADKSEITEFITAEDVELAVSGKADSEELVSQNEYLEKKLKIFEEMLFNVKSKVGTKISSIENISGDINEDIVIELNTPINDVKSVSGLTITVTELNVESGRVVFTTPGDTIIQNLSTFGNLPQGVSNAQFSINTQGNVNISNCDDLNQTSYNCFEIGLSNEPPKSVTIENVHIKGTLRNNAISIFGTVDDAVINISNVIIDNCSNPIRISNKTNASGVVLNLINCEFTQWEAGQYAGAIICQDYTSTTAALAQENNLFAPTKITINFINCTHNGEKIAFTDPAEICTTGDENQVIYVYTDREGIIPYNVDRYPTITCK